MEDFRTHTVRAVLPELPALLAASEVQMRPTWLFGIASWLS
jgi:hypothetical protein